MKEPGRESENSPVLPSFQAANLCLQSTLWQRQACENINPTCESGFASHPGITSWERGGRTPHSKGAVSLAGHCGGSPHVTHATASSTKVDYC